MAQISGNNAIYLGNEAITINTIEEPRGVGWDALQNVCESMMELIQAFRAAEAKQAREREEKEITEQWVRTWGEVVYKKDAQKMLNISDSHLNKLIRQGKLQATPDNRVLVRQAAEWYNSQKAQQAEKQQERRGRKPRIQRFVP